MECEFVKISKEKLKDNCFIVKLGSESRPATEEDMVKLEYYKEHLEEDNPVPEDFKGGKDV